MVRDLDAIDPDGRRAEGALKVEVDEGTLPRGRKGKVLAVPEHVARNE